MVFCFKVNDNELMFAIWAANISILNNTGQKVAIFYIIWGLGQNLCREKG
jgi:hypothetical protein